MRKILFALVAALALWGCEKEDSFIGSRWITSLSNQGYVMEFMSDSDVRIYACDANYNYWSSLQNDTYIKSGNHIDFSGSGIGVGNIYNYKFFQFAEIDGDIMTIHAENKNGSGEDYTYMRLDR